MDKAVAEKFCDDLGLSKEHIAKYEKLYSEDILPAISRHYLSHIVTTVEELINEKRKQEFLAQIKEINANGKSEIDYALLEKSVNKKILRLFSIILKPVGNGKVKARSHLIGGYGVLITYWDNLEEGQIRILIAHELGHIANRHLFGNKEAASEEGLASLFAYIALQDRSDFYKSKSKQFTREFDLQIYNDVVNMCHKKNTGNR
ncbi:MAG: hypothetical protein FWG66_02155 [Spirochaetes bacterium]|nr:hypothetical protein [Spirochaetota bacterium]